MVRRMQKRGIIKILEAMTAILILVGVLLFLSGRQQATGQQEISSLLPPLLEEVARNDSLRSLVVTEGPGAEGSVEMFLSERLTNPALGFSVRICDLSVPCGLTHQPSGVRDIFVAERVIASTLRNHQPWRVKLFLWERSA